MTTTIQTIRTAAAACIFAAFLAGTLAPGFASARAGHHDPESPAFNVKRDPASPHDSIVVTWEEVHYHHDNSHVPRRQRSGFIHMATIGLPDLCTGCPRGVRWTPLVGQEGRLSKCLLPCS